MTHAHILGPPRTGRKVLTKEQALEEIAGWSEERGESASQDIVVPTGQKSSSGRKGKTPQAGNHTAKDYFLFPGRFEVGGFDETQDFFTFYELRLPMGSWNELALYRHFDETSKKMFKDWNQPDPMDVGLPPADIWYGLAAVCYLNKERLTLPTIIRDRVFFPDSMNSKPYTSTSVFYHKVSLDQVKVGLGWRSKHPFHFAYSARIAGTNCVIADPKVQAQPDVASALLGLLGEDDPSRCKNVLEWAMIGSPSVLFHAPSKGPCPVCFFRRNFAFPTIDAASNPNIERPGRMIMADSIDYKRQ